MLHIEGVSFRYREATSPALADLTLDIPAGAVYGLLGPNGAGKTTLISLLAGLLKTATGNILLHGQPLADARAANPRAIALVPQDYAFYPMLTVAENLRFFGGVLGLTGADLKAQTDAAIVFARLEQVTAKRAEQLSGGLRRRLNLAIGLLGQPQLLLLDEPTVGVDPQSRHFLLDAIAALPAAGTTVIYTSHYMEEVEAICQRIAIIDQGRLLAEGSLADILHSPEPQVELQLDLPLPEDIAERYTACPLGHLQYRLDLASTTSLPRLLDELAAAGCTVRHLNLGQHDLEQFFMRLTKRSLRD
ncbi:ABC transporter ATP-binding protein [Ferribacterium limneticum]|uniref:ABC transporter ATP-binding protein n=1 Tax=Ferribacterium limneticum TaxID=76259 RepID=UPI001CFAFF78|nr:ABC transporter ATP-binding protein [Ferribacterium limneticum]UCV30347.1 ABC transporter ATP-binding protein [Ferribacterium limneticum]UCV34265.1 ABC transporter ATP-binding protein [Ferribacterium limneticum]